MEVREMQRRLALLATSTALVLGAAVVAAAPAEARNLGGDKPARDICVLPGHATYGSPNSGLPCICVVLPNEDLARNVGKGPNTACPPGTVTLP
jgi:hypothetical protein